MVAQIPMIACLEKCCLMGDTWIKWIPPYTAERQAAVADDCVLPAPKVVAVSVQLVPYMIPEQQTLKTMTPIS